MIEYIEGDLFHSPAQVIVNTVNTVGIMGKGLALSYKKRYPTMFETYQRACEKRQLTIGKLILCYTPDHWILLFPTKVHWRSPSKLSYIEDGLKKFVSIYADKRITSIAFPKLGCGNGELKWDDVRPLMERYLKPLPITVYIYVGTDATQTAEAIQQEETENWLQRNARDLSFPGLCDMLRRSNATLLPETFSSGEAKCTAVWEDGLTITDSSGTDRIYTEEMLLNIWDRVQSCGVLPLDEELEPERPFFDLLLTKGYVSQVRFPNGPDGKTVTGYQLNEGYGRMYAIQEAQS